ncbi:hypothetical protein NE235_17395 [Actinoallomurus spadix]|uniref:Uncharacterized protein n=1 Tax=Actinoallomurus spadix TaxID=79912 RepID=A0ABP3H476_9ACTN|nr:hypothetical protein [Actinoallomurus spadix]MCO5987879.1 hypothetical protein [Actinoallomurus spadix]
MTEQSGQEGAERGAAEEATGTPVTPTEEEAGHGPAGEAPGDEGYRPPGGMSRPEDLNPDDFE